MLEGSGQAARFSISPISALGPNGLIGRICMCMLLNSDIYISISEKSGKP